MNSSCNKITKLESSLESDLNFKKYWKNADGDNLICISYKSWHQLALKLKSYFINPSSHTAYIRQNDVQLKPEHFQSEYFTKLICSPAHGTHILMKWKITCILVQGRFFSGYVDTIPDSFCTGTKPYRIGILWTHENCDFGAISVKERSCAALTSKVESHISDRCSYYTGELLMSAQQSIRYHVKIAWKACPAIRCKWNVIIPICESAWITK